MAFLDGFQVDKIKAKIVQDPSTLGKIYKSKKSRYLERSVDHSLVEDYIKEGWEEVAILKTKTKIQKEKTHDKKFEDDVWCQLYELGFRILNYDDQFFLPFSKDPKDKKQIDVIGVDAESILIIECKSSEEPKKAPSYKEEFDSLSLRMGGFIKALKQIFGEDKKIKYVFATRNLRINADSDDLKRLRNTNSFYYNDNTYNYINNLIIKYKHASKFQFFGLIFKNELINKEKIEIPALKGKMGDKDYYMFSIEPALLLKMGFVLHRTRANESEFPTYQRLLVPSRLNGITKFIDDGGYFPNSVIINFSDGKNKVVFEPHSRSNDSNSRTGTLKIPNVYGIAYIIDGQHRVYGYANSRYLYSNTVPVVAFDNLETSEQLEMFMDINQNQKAVSPSLRLDLEEDLYWNADRADSRLKALRSSITKKLANTNDSPLYNLISVGEDDARLAFKPFTTAISNSGLLPAAKGNKYLDDSVSGALYDLNNQDHSKEMYNSRKKIYDLLVACYELVSTEYPQFFKEERSLIISPRGTYAYICTIGRLNKFLTESGKVTKSTSSEERVVLLTEYLRVLLNELSLISDNEKERMWMIRGGGADIEWLMVFQSKINDHFPEYQPKELIEWKQRKDKALQAEGSNLINLIEEYLKKVVLDQLAKLYGNDWEYEIGSIKKECQIRADQENEQNYKEGLGAPKVHWTDKFTISDYKNIITKKWTAAPKGEKVNENFLPFEQIFSININGNGDSRTERTKWLSYLNSYRKKVAHRGTIGVGLNKEEVEFLKLIAKKLKLRVEL